MNEIIFLIEEAAEAESMDALRNQIRDAVRCYFDAGQAPKVIRLHFVREEVIAA